MAKTIDLSFSKVSKIFSLDPNLENCCKPFKLHYSKNNVWFDFTKAYKERLRVMKRKNNWLFHISFMDKKTKESFFVTEQMFPKLIYTPNNSVEESGVSSYNVGEIISFFLTNNFDKNTIIEYLKSLEEGQVLLSSLQKECGYE
jgi:hypothetical protein